MDWVVEAGCRPTISFSATLVDGAFRQTFRIVSNALFPYGRCAVVRAVAADMPDLSDVITNRFAVKRYTLSLSSYGFIIRPSECMCRYNAWRSLKPGGRVAVFAPHQPHGLLIWRLALRHCASSERNRCVLEQRCWNRYFSRHFPHFEIHHFHNVMTLPLRSTISYRILDAPTYPKAFLEWGKRCAVRIRPCD